MLQTYTFHIVLIGYLKRGANVNLKNENRHNPLYCLMNKYDLYHEDHLETEDRTTLAVLQFTAYTSIQHEAKIKEGYNAFPNALRFMQKNGPLHKK